MLCSCLVSKMMMYRWQYKVVGNILRLRRCREWVEGVSNEPIFRFPVCLSGTEWLDMLRRMVLGWERVKDIDILLID